MRSNKASEINGLYLIVIEKMHCMALTKPYKHGARVVLFLSADHPLLQYNIPGKFTRITETEMNESIFSVLVALSKGKKVDKIILERIALAMGKPMQVTKRLIRKWVKQSVGIGSKNITLLND